MYNYLDINEARKRTLKLLPFLYKIKYYEKENKEFTIKRVLNILKKEVKRKKKTKKVQKKMQKAVRAV